ncbi:MAG: cobaltochelatase subunit CobT, partial [Bosea sp. (in: a-proteobacteria)]|nr:cobaltochelatase subunit CobT [Bosea sp. (in: a-proteobacteria)]
MSISNRKPGTTKEAPAEPLKRAISSTMKAIARKPEMEIVFAADKPSLVGERARLPEPPRKLTAQDVAILRGHSDSMALRLACHDASVHRRAAPEGDAARAVFDAVEQARVECVGARRMAGMAGNITAMLEDRYHRGGRYEEITDRADAPLEDALALMVRERLTGLKPPKAAEKLVDLWREQIEAKAGADLDRLGKAVEDQRAFARTVRDMLASLDMAEQTAQGEESEEDEDDKDQSSDEQQQQDGEAEQESAGERSEVEVSDDATEELQEGATEASDAPSG